MGFEGDGSWEPPSPLSRLERKAKTKLSSKWSTDRRAEARTVQRNRLQKGSRRRRRAERQARSVGEILLIGQVVKVDVSAQAKGLGKSEHLGDSQIDVEETPGLIQTNGS